MMRSVLLLSIVLILFSGSHFSAEAAPRIPKHPDQALIRNVIHGFPGWKLNSSGRCAQMRQSGLWAWKIVLERNIDPAIKSSASLNGKGYIIIVIVPDVGIDPGRGLIEHLDWNMPGNDLVQYTAYLGRGKGSAGMSRFSVKYRLNYAKTDICRNFFKFYNFVVHCVPPDTFYCE